MKCQVCKKNEAVNKHHLIPKSATKKLAGEDSPWRKKIIHVCYECHQTIHESAILHLIMSKQISNYSKYEAVMYNLFKEYIKKSHPDAMKGWKNHRTMILKKLVMELMNEDNK